MSLRYEEYEALRRTKQLLSDLMHPSTTPKTKKELRERVYRCLKHFPFLDETGKPMFSGDPFTKDSPEGYILKINSGIQGGGDENNDSKGIQGINK